MSFADELVQLSHRPAIDLGCGFGDFRMLHRIGHVCQLGFGQRTR